MTFKINPPRHFDTVTREEYERWFPKTRPEATAPPAPEPAPIPAGQPFEIGLVMAGAVSAGAYTAGVLDFLFQALDAWHAARAAGAAVPRHDVRLRILTGASAGGMNAAIMATACRKSFPHISAANHGKEGAGNPFYDAWVRQIKIADLLDTGDLEGGGPVGAVLNCATLDRIIARVLDFQGEPADQVRRAWLDDPFQVVLTLTNLSGVPYAVRFSGPTDLYHEMFLHRDDIRFGVPVFEDMATDAVPPDVIRLGREVSPDDDGWHSLGVSALATGAFPLALKPREILRQRTDYEYRYAYMNTQGDHIYAKPWPEDAEGAHRFYSVDGGAMNNEPFEIARRFLSGSNGRNPRKGLEACRAIVMVDPFTDAGADSARPDPGLPAIARRLLAACIQQSRFNQIDLSLAEADDVYSRFLIAPSRAGKRGQAAIASGGLGGFLGFFDETLRHHDFLLGRANCQRFLRDWFVLPAANPLIAGKGTPEDVLNDPAFRSRAASRADHVQIIPLVGDAALETGMPDWSKVKCDGYAPLERAVKRRLDTVYPALRNEMLKGSNKAMRILACAYLWPAWKCFLRPRLLDLAKSSIDTAAEALKRG